MIRSKYLSAIALFLIMGSFIQLVGQAIDNVPRDRIVSDEELLDLLDPDFPRFAPIFEQRKNGNVDGAIHLLGEYLRNRKNVSYFFDLDNIESRVEYFKDTYPDFAEKVILSADKFMEAYGKQPTWKMPGKDLLGRPHTPNTVRNIARQPLAGNIALSYYLTEDAKYLEYFQEITRDFIKSYEAGETEAGANDVFERFYAGHRLRNWLFAYYLYSCSFALTHDDLIFMLKVYLLHGAREIDVCKVFHYGNHQLHGLAALYEMSVMFPEIPVMNYWNKEAVRVIMEHIEIEIKADGFQFERASHYFKFDIINYLRIYLVAGTNGKKLPDLYYSRFHAMFDAIVALSKPDKDLPVLMDAQARYKEFVGKEGKKTFSNDAAELKDPTVGALMAVATVLYKDPSYKFFSSEMFPPDLYWFFNPDAIDLLNTVEKKTPEMGSIGLVESEFYVMRSGWNKDDLYMLIDGGLAKEKPDHTHGQQLGFIAYSHGSEILPGHRVRYSDPSYRTMKNSLVKNIALVDGILLGQIWHSNHSRTGFGIWKSLPQPKVNLWHSGNEYDFFSGTHNAYDELGVQYERSIVFFKPLGWIITDHYKSDGFHQYEQIYQGDFILDDQYNRAIKEFADKTLYILQADPTKMELTSVQNFWTQSVKFTKRDVKNHMFNTLVMPVSKKNEMVPEIRLFERDFYRQVLVFAGPDRFSLYFNKAQNIKLDELKTDGQIIASRYVNDKLHSAYLQNFTLCTIEGITVSVEKKGSLEFTVSEKGQVTINQLSDCGEVKINGKVYK